MSARPSPDGPVVVIVTGPPGGGKTFVATRLAARLGMPYLSKDLFKETLFDSLGYSDREWSRRLGGASMALLYRTAAAMLEAGTSVVLESNFYPAWDGPRLGELIARFGCRVVQVVCSAPVDVLVERFERRALSGERHPGHADASSLDELLARIRNERWDAMDLPGEVLMVDTTAEVDVLALARVIASAQ